MRRTGFAAALFLGLHPLACQRALSFSVKALAFPKSPLAKNRETGSGREKYVAAQKQKPGVAAGLWNVLALDCLISRALQSGAQAGRPFGSPHSCERCCAAQRASAPARRSPLP